MLNTFTLVQRVTFGLELMENRSIEIIDKFLKSLIELHELIPMKITINDKMEIVRAILHLQDSKNIKTRDIANGIINGENIRDPLNSADICEVGNYLNYLQEEVRATEWYEQALRTLEKEEFKETTALKIYESMFVNYWNNNKTLEAIEINRIILKIDPYNVQANSMKKIIHEILAKDEFFDPDFDL